MKKELIGIIICVLLIITVLPASGINLEKTYSDIPNISAVIKPGLEHETILGCSGVIWYTGDSGDDDITINVSFNVYSYSLKGEYLGKSSISHETTMNYRLQASYHIIPDYYGETFTWVHAKLDVENVDNSEQTESHQVIGLSIGQLIYFSTVLSLIYNLIDILT